MHRCENDFSPRLKEIAPYELINSMSIDWEFLFLRNLEFQRIHWEKCEKHSQWNEMINNNNEHFRNLKLRIRKVIKTFFFSFFDEIKWMEEQMQMGWDMSFQYETMLSDF